MFSICWNARLFLLPVLYLGVQKEKRAAVSKKPSPRRTSTPPSRSEASLGNGSWPQLVHQRAEFLAALQPLGDARAGRLLNAQHRLNPAVGKDENVPV